MDVDFGNSVRSDSGDHTGYSLVNGRDPQDERRIKSRFFKVVLGVAIVACAPWLANQILNYFM